MDIKHARRILAIGAPDSGVLDVLKDLTGTAPEPHENGSTAGLTHEWDAQTTYYNAKVPIWIDEIPNADEWKSEFLKPEAKEVVEAVGAWIYCFRVRSEGTIEDDTEETLKAVQAVVEEHASFETDAVMLAVAVPAQRTAQATNLQNGEDLEDTFQQYGFELIDYAGKGTNEFGEKTGIERLKEALEANEWTAADMEDDELDLDDFDVDAEDDMNGIGQDEAEMTAELFGVKAALAGADLEPEAEDFAPPSKQESQVEDMNRLMGRLLAVKEQSADLPEAQRKRMAAKAIRELMKDGAV